MAKEAGLPKVKGDKNASALMGLLPLFDGGRNIGVSELLGQGHVEGAPSLMELLGQGGGAAPPAAAAGAAPLPMMSGGAAPLPVQPQPQPQAPAAAAPADGMAALMASAPAIAPEEDGFARRSQMRGLRREGIDPGQLASMFMNGRSGRG